jgi:hypothetical protein
MAAPIRDEVDLSSAGSAPVALLLASTFLLPSCGCNRGRDTEGDRNRAFASSMSGVTLVGYSTRLNREGLSKEERYDIDKISHVTGDTWLFQTRLKYDGHDIPVPIPLTIKWAGDTPVITMTDLAIPGVGTFTARVVLYREQYAGTWSGKNAGGQLFGKIIKR